MYLFEVDVFNNLEFNLEVDFAITTISIRFRFQFSWKSHKDIVVAVSLVSLESSNVHFYSWNTELIYFIVISQSLATISSNFYCLHLKE